jgi:hypothetical protein
MADMDNDVKQVIDQVANGLQVLNVLPTRLRRGLGESAQHAIDLESAASRAVAR